MKKLRILFPIFLTIASIVAILTGTLTYFKIWFSQDFLWFWGKSFLPTLCIIAPLGMFLTFIWDRFLSWCYDFQSLGAKKIALTIFMWLTLELVVSAITLISNFQWEHFFVSWMTLYVSSLPVGMVVWGVMSFIVKPWMNNRLALIQK